MVKTEGFIIIYSVLIDDLCLTFFCINNGYRTVIRNTLLPEAVFILVERIQHGTKSAAMSCNKNSLVFISRIMNQLVKKSAVLFMTSATLSPSGAP